MSIEIFDDDIEQLRDDLSVEPWNVISNDDVRNSCQLPIRISYEFVDMGDTEYGFNQNFSEKDTFEYFDCMKYISGRTIDELLMDDDFRLRRHSALHKPLKSALDKLELGILKDSQSSFILDYIRIRSKWLQEKVVFVRPEYTLCKGCMV